MSLFSDLKGTTLAYFKLGIAGVRLVDNAGNLKIRNTGDTVDAELTASKLNISGNSLVINSDAASTGADFKYTIKRPVTGMAADIALVLPVNNGTPGQVCSTDGNGILSWTSAASTSLCDKVDVTNLAFGATSPVAMFSTGVADVINKIEVIVDTAFNGTDPTLSIGVTGTTSKYLGSTDVDLKTAGIYEVHPGLVAGGIEALIASYASASSTTGAARIQVYYASPA